MQSSKTILFTIASKEKYLGVKVKEVKERFQDGG
jgi:hypothetical protein